MTTKSLLQHQQMSTQQNQLRSDGLWWSVKHMRKWAFLHEYTPLSYSKNCVLCSSMLSLQCAFIQHDVE